MDRLIQQEKAMTKKGSKHLDYRTVGVKCSVNQASPHRLIQMLLEGAMKEITLARAAIGREDQPAKASHITSAHAVIEGLQVSLDKEKGQDIANNLDGLYEYMALRLVEANLKDDDLILDEVLELLSNIKSAWDAIGQPSSGSLQEDQTPTQSGGISVGV